MGYHREHGLDTRILRIFNTYGPRIRSDGAYGRAIPRFIMQAISGSSLTVYGNGSQTRSFCFVSDTIGGVLSALSSKGARGEVVNIGGVGEISVLELATKIIAKVGRPVGVRHRPLPIDDPKRRCPDISKAKTLIRWAPKVDLDEGLKLTIQWFKEKK